MTVTRSLVPALLLLTLAGCPQPEPTPSKRARSGKARRAQTAPAATPVAAPAAAPIVLADLEGEWTRDDGKRYRIVVVGDRLLGRRIDEAADDLGCRLDLVAQGRGLRGQATFSDKGDEGCRLVLAWELEPAPGGALKGRVEGVDLDDEGRETGRRWEPRTWSRSRTLPAAELEAGRKLAAVDRMIDQALGEDDPAALMALFGAPAVRDLEHVAGRDEVGARLMACASRLGPPAPTRRDDAGRGDERRGDERRDDERAVEASAPRGSARDGSASSSEGGTVVLAPHLPLSIDAPVSCDVIGSDGSVSLSGERFALNIVQDDDRATGRELIPSSFSDDVRGILEESTDHVIYDIDVGGEAGVSFELRVTIDREAYHAFPDRFTAYTRADVDVMLRAARTLRASAPTPPSRRVTKRDAPSSTGGASDMGGFLSRFTGEAASVTAALDAFGADGLERHGMDWYDLREPKVVGAQQDGSRERFTIECQAGMTTRTYVLVWESGRIVEVVDGGMR